MTRFDRFADRVENKVASATFFTGCVLLVLVWAPSFFLIGDINTWQLIINTITTIVTFLLVALLQNTQHQFEAEVNEKLDQLLARTSGGDG